MIKKIFKVILGIVGVFLIVAVAGFGFLMIGQSSGKKLEINDLDFSKLKDGTYEGVHKAGRWTNTMKVTVADGKVKGIKVIHDVMFPQAGVSKKLADSVVKAQSLKVDTIAGGTVTSKAYLKAMENAMEHAR